MQDKNEMIENIKAFLQKKWVHIFLAIYIAVVLIYSISFILSDGKNVLLPSNELGDFLAGIISPIAFLFLILGYLQQKNVIAENTKILSEQMEELRLSKKLMVETNQPHFTFSDYELDYRDGFELLSIRLKIKNENQNCNFQELSFFENSEKVRSLGEGLRYLARGDSLQCQITIQKPLSFFPHERIYAVIYTDILGNNK